MSLLRQRTLAAWERWAEAAGPWRRWALCVPLLAPGLDELSRPEALGRRPRSDSRADVLVQELIPHLGETLVLLDLPPVLGVRVAARLAADGLAWSLLRLERWPYAEAVLPARPLVGALLAEVRRLPRSGTALERRRGVVLVLDGERQRPLAGRLLADPRADNRFELDGDALPNAPALRVEGIGRVLDVRLSAELPPPLGTYVYPAYRAAGIEVGLLHLAKSPVGSRNARAHTVPHCETEEEPGIPA